MTHARCLELLDESKASMREAQRRAVSQGKEPGARSFWHAWACSFKERCLSLEALLPRLQEREVKLASGKGE